MASKKDASKKDPMLSVISNIEKNIGNKGDPVISRFGDRDYEKVPSISFGIDAVDKASNCGGVPRGKMAEIFGPESGGKSYLCLKLIASAQKTGKACLIDAEQSFDPIWAEQHGVDVDDLYVLDEGMSAEKILDYIAALCESGAFNLVVVDSTAALIPAKELDGSVADQDYALLARAMSKGCKKIVAQCGATNTTCVFINQIREKMGVTWGSNETTTGGRALKFYSHQRIKVSPGAKIITQIEGEDVVIGRKSYVSFEKNKTASPFGKCEITIVFDKAANNPVFKLVSLARDCKLIPVRNGLYSLHKEVLETPKNVPIEAKSLADVADFLVHNELVGNIVDCIIDYAKDEATDLVKDKIDLDILQLKDADPKSIESPVPPEASTARNLADILNPKTPKTESS